MLNREITLSELCNGVRHQIIICDNPAHCHNSRVQEMFGVEYRGHHVAITKDGDTFNVRIDGNIMTTKMDISWEEVEEYVEKMTR